MPITRLQSTGNRRIARPFSPTLVVFFVCSTLLTSCHCETASLPLEVWYDGCSAVWSGPTCLLSEPRQVLLWIKTAPSARLDIDFGKGTTLQELEPKGGGKRFQITVAHGTTLGRLMASTDNARGQWQIALADEPKEPPWLVEARRLRQEPKTEEAIRLIDGHLTDTNLTWRARALGLRGRLALDQGQIDQACTWLEQAGHLHKEMGHDSEATGDFAALAFQHIEFTRRFAQARRALELIRLPAGHTASEMNREARLFNLARQTGDISRAISCAETCLKLSSRRFEEPVLLYFELDDITIQNDLGYFREAAIRLEKLRQGLTQDTPACLRKMVLNNEAWTLILANEEAVDAPGPDPIPLLEEAQQLLEGPCAMPQGRANNRINLALAHLHQDHIEDVKANLSWLSQQKGKMTPVEEASTLEIEGRLALGEGRQDAALALFEEQERLAEVWLLQQERWRAVVWQARALAQQSLPQRALQQYDRAESLARKALLRVPIGANRGAFEAQHRGAVREHVELLLREKRIDAAMQLVREQRVRALDALSLSAGLSTLPKETRAKVETTLESYWNLRKSFDDQAAADWQLPEQHLVEVRQRRKEEESQLNELLNRAYGQAQLGNTTELTPRLPGELILLFFGLDRGWLGFAQDDVETTMRELGQIDLQDTPAVLAKRLLEPFDGMMERATRIKVLSMAEMDQISFTSLPWRDAPLSKSRTVVYGLDLAPRALSREAADKPLFVAVVDPSYDLPGARSESAILRKALRDFSTSLRLHDRADVSAALLAEELGQASVFHFSGHGRYQGSGGWDSGLVLSEGSEFQVTDVLSLQSSPRTAVLMGCETARASSEWSVGLGLAHAFLLAGSQVVLASSQPIPDALGAPLVAALYDGWKNHSLSVPEIHEALSRIATAHPDSGWESLRILVH